MMGLAFFAAVILGLTLYGVADLLCEAGAGRQRRQIEGTDRGPVPGYALFPPEAIDRCKLGLAGPWRPTSLETFHSKGRRRLVVTASPVTAGRVPGGGETIDMLERATRMMVVNTGAEVVVIELSASPHGPSERGAWTAMRSVDGRGWSGRGAEGAFVVEVPGSPRLIGQG